MWSDRHVGVMSELRCVWGLGTVSMVDLLGWGVLIELGRSVI